MCLEGGWRICLVQEGGARRAGLGVGPRSLKNSEREGSLYHSVSRTCPIRVRARGCEDMEPMARVGTCGPGNSMTGELVVNVSGNIAMDEFVINGSGNINIGSLMGH